MPVTRRQAVAGLAALLAVPAFAIADDTTVTLGESAKPSDLFRCELQLTVGGKMKFDRDGKSAAVTIQAKARHDYVERIETTAEHGLVQKAVRFYREATAERVSGVDRTKQELAVDRRGIAVQRTAAGPLHFNPTGPLTRDELELVSEHFDTLALGGLLPGKAVRVGDTWSAAADAVQAVCLFDGLVKSDLAGKLTEIKDGVASFTLDGKAEGIEQGASVKLAISARGTFDVAKQAVVSLHWEQTDDRDQGPISPAVEAKVTIDLTRSRVADEPKELAEVRARQPADGKVPAVLTQLKHADGGYELLYPRDWHIVVKNDKHLVLRLLSRGEFVAQVTLTGWKPTNAAADAKAAVEEFVEATKKQSGWEPEQVIENGLLQADAGRQLYRLAVRGKQDGVAVVQAFHLLSSADGRHVAMASVCDPANATKLGTQDVALITAVDFPAKK